MVEERDKLPPHIPVLADAVSQEDIVGSVDKLERMNNDRRSSPYMPDQEVPVLNDIVSADEVIAYVKAKLNEDATKSPAFNIKELTVERLAGLVDTFDQILSKELEAMTISLKSKVKQEIISELKEQLKKTAEQQK